MKTKKSKGFKANRIDLEMLESYLNPNIIFLHLDSKDNFMSQSQLKIKPKLIIHLNFIWILLWCLLFSNECYAQNENANEKVWENSHINYNAIIVPKKYQDENIVIIKDKCEFNLSSLKNKTLVRTVLLKINNSVGLQSIDTLTFPESFDNAYNTEFWQQGRSSKIKIPYIFSYDLKSFAARVIKSNGTVKDIKTKKSFWPVRWIGKDGAYVDDNAIFLAFEGLEVGDFLEFTYTLDYSTKYGSDVFYLASKFPKLNVEYSYKYQALPIHKNYKFLMSSNIADSCIFMSHVEKSKDITLITQTVKMKDIQKVNYFIHAMSSKQLPYVYFNFNYNIRMLEERSYAVADLPDYSWINPRLLEDNEDQLYTHFYEGIRKFISKMPTFENDSNQLNFLKAINDTLNTFNYYTRNYLYYNDPRLYNIYSVDHLLKRRITDFHLLNVYQSIFSERKIPYYIANVQDKRLGEHNPLTRNRLYENIILAIPYKKTFQFNMPRYNGLKYFINEIPFYYEGALTAMFPAFYDKTSNKDLGTFFKFSRISQGSENDNTRSESCLVNIKVDSNLIHLQNKEMLSGQFSTILRPFYFHEAIDSSIHPVYFKKCTTKPNSLDVKMKLTSKSETFPFRHVFNTSQRIRTTKLGEIDLKDWFSFHFKKELYPEKPSHDFYFDFKLTDVYNFMLTFDKPVSILNEADFAQQLSNEYFEINSEITKNGDNYLLAVIVKVKATMIPWFEAEKFEKFVSTLDKINSYVVKYKSI